MPLECSQHINFKVQARASARARCLASKRADTPRGRRTLTGDSLRQHALCPVAAQPCRVLAVPQQVPAEQMHREKERCGQRAPARNIHRMFVERKSCSTEWGPYKVNFQGFRLEICPKCPGVQSTARASTGKVGNSPLLYCAHLPPPPPSRGEMGPRVAVDSARRRQRTPKPCTAAFTFVGRWGRWGARSRAANHRTFASSLRVQRRGGMNTTTAHLKAFAN